MDHEAKHPNAEPARRPASEFDGELAHTVVPTDGGATNSVQRRVAEAVASSPRIVAQRALLSTIDRSPHAVAQRASFDRAFGASSAREAAHGHDGGISPLRSTLQLKKVSDDHVGDDLQHPQATRLFSTETMDWWNLPTTAKATKRQRTESVEDGREHINYAQLRNTTLENSQGLHAWLGKDAHEHMYVHEGSSIYTGGRDREKLPHPTLVGGDPDATCAGTMSLDRTRKTVTVTNESGHFRPSKVASATVEAVKDVLPKPAKGKGGYKVVKQEV